MTQKISTKPDINDPAFQAGHQKAVIRLKAFQMAVDFLNKYMEPAKKIQSEILQNVAVTPVLQDVSQKIFSELSVIQKASRRVFTEIAENLEGLQLQEKLEMMEAMITEISAEEKFDVQNEIRKLKKLLNEHQKTFSSADVNKIASLCLKLGEDFVRSLHSETLSRESERVLAHMEYREQEDSCIRVKYEEYLKFLKEGLNKRESARRVFKTWEKRRPNDKETDSLLRKIRRYEQRNHLN